MKGTPVTERAIHELIRERRKLALQDGKTAQDEIIKFVYPALHRIIMRSSDTLKVALQMLIKSYLPEGKARIIGQYRQGNFFETLDEHTLHIGEQTYFKFRGRFTVFDGDQLLRQKRRNVVTAGQALKQWEWEWSIIRPLLVAHSDWLYEDAIKHLLANGGLPTPPKFEQAA